MYLSIIIPVYNESKTIIELLKRVEAQNSVVKEIIVVDDCSNDGTLDLIQKYKFKINCKILLHKKNLGKGAAINTAKKYVSGEIVAIQDADLEYDPADYRKLLEPILNKKFNVVYGSRVLNRKRYSLTTFTSISRVMANHILTIISNIINKQKLTDAHTCYKFFSKNVFDQIELKEKGFAFCPEVTTKISNLNYDIYEVPISYNGREYDQGKKIKLIDGFFAIKALFKYKFFI